MSRRSRGPRRWQRTHGKGSTVDVEALIRSALEAAFVRAVSGMILDAYAGRFGPGAQSTVEAVVRKHVATLS